jgi:hypothetical protein
MSYRSNKIAFNQPVGEFVSGKNLEHEGKVPSVFTVDKSRWAQTTLV